MFTACTCVSLQARIKSSFLCICSLHILWRFMSLLRRNHTMKQNLYVSELTLVPVSVLSFPRGEKAVFASCDLYPHILLNISNRSSHEAERINTLFYALSKFVRLTKCWKTFFCSLPFIFLGHSL